jgi:hypothetical protein
MEYSWHEERSGVRFEPGRGYQVSVTSNPNLQIFQPYQSTPHAPLRTAACIEHPRARLAFPDRVCSGGKL